MSRDEMAAVLMEIAEGRVPKDRIALKCLYDDMVNWPFLEVGEASGGQGQATASTSSKAAPSPSEYAALAGGAWVWVWVCGRWRCTRWVWVQGGRGAAHAARAEARIAQLCLLLLLSVVHGGPRVCARVRLKEHRFCNAVTNTCESPSRPGAWCFRALRVHPATRACSLRCRCRCRCAHQGTTGPPKAITSLGTAAGHVPPTPPRPAGDSIAKPYVMGNDTRKGDKPQNLADMLPDWVGYGVLYGFSSIPVLLAVGVVLVLFFNSLK